MPRNIRRFMTASLLLASFTAAPAFSQYYNNAPYNQDHALFERARIDLDRASRYPYASRADRKRFDEARRDMFDFESRFDQGRYEHHQLDHAIDRIDKVVRENSLDPRDRGALEEDLRRMRDYRRMRS